MSAGTAEGREDDKRNGGSGREAAKGGDLPKYWA